MDLQLQATLISGGCNAVYGCIDTFENTIIYGCHNQIYLYDISSTSVKATLSSHKKRVNQCKYINHFENLQVIISGSSEGLINVWQNQTNDIYNYQEWKVKFQNQMKGCTNFLSISPIKNYKNNVLILFSDTEGAVKLSQLTNESLQERETLIFGQHNIIESSALQQINDDLMIVALGSLDFFIYIYQIKVQELFEQKQDINKVSFMQYRLALKGHENSIMDLKFNEFVSIQENNSYYLLASASRDGYIRLWKIQQKKQGLQNDKQSFQQQQQISIFDEKNTFNLNNDYQLSLESVLKGHQDAVVSVCWGLEDPSGNYNENKKYEDKAALLSASSDCSLYVWSKDRNSDVWLNKNRLGQISGSKYSFFNALFAKNSQLIVSNTLNGAFYIWERQEEGFFKLRPSITGHFSYVNDIDWSSGFEFLASCSSDQTSRIFIQNNKQQVQQKDRKRPIWNEISRSQIHGYDINSIKLMKVNCPFQQQIKKQNPNEQYQCCDILICGAEEKILRLYEPSAIFVNYINNLSQMSMHLFFPTQDEESKYLAKTSNNTIQYLTQAEGGQQVLGLMTKQVKVEREKVTTYYEAGEQEDEGEENEEDQQQQQQQKFDENYSEPPHEEYLIKHTLWPELNKMYGHGYEISTVACNHEGTLIASACKSQTKETSCILFWNPNNYLMLQKLPFHNYTVMQIEFSHNDEYLGSVSRDRQFALYKKKKIDMNALQDNNKNQPLYELIFNDSSHSRIVWSLSFSHDDLYVVTGSRDKKIKIWGIQEKPNEATSIKKISESSFKCPITAVAFADKFSSTGKATNQYIMALGYEDGVLQIFTFFHQEVKMELLYQIPSNLSHTEVVRRIKFRKTIHGDNHFEFASCSDDFSVRIFEFQ